MRLLDRSYFTDLATNTIYIPVTLPSPLLLIPLMFLSLSLVDAYSDISSSKEGWDEDAEEEEEEEESISSHISVINHYN